VPGSYTDDDEEVILALNLPVGASSSFTFPVPVDAPADALYTVVFGGFFSNPAQAYWLKAIVW